MEKNSRTTKKQRELLAFIDAFIKSNNFGPSYREIMRALGYKSVSTVAVHVDGLIAKGYLQKTDNSARSIKVMRLHETAPSTEHASWLVEQMNTILATHPQHHSAFLSTLQALRIDAKELSEPTQKMTKA